MKKEFVGSVLSTSVAGATTAVQTDIILQRVSIILTIIATIITILIGVRAWWKDAKKDGKIDKKEVKDLIDIVDNGVKEIKGHLENKEDKKNDI